MVPDSFYELGVEGRFAILLMVDSKTTPAQRAESIRKIRQMPYQQFLESVYWKTVRDYVVSQHNRCESCRQEKPKEVHHKSYQHHGEEHLYTADLMAVCRLCHEILQAKFDNKSEPSEIHDLYRKVNGTLILAERQKGVSDILREYLEGHSL